MVKMYLDCKHVAFFCIFYIERALSKSISMACFFLWSRQANENTTNIVRIRRTYIFFVIFFFVLNFRYTEYLTTPMVTGQAKMIHVLTSSLTRATLIIFNYYYLYGLRRFHCSNAHKFVHRLERPRNIFKAALPFGCNRNSNRRPSITLVQSPADSRRGRAPSSRSFHAFR